MTNQPQPFQPILAMMTYRGGARLARCLESIAESEHHFKRIILSVTANEDSDDMHQCREFQRNVLPRAEVICTGKELPTMQHQAFWVTYLEQSGTQPSDWIYWLAYDDQVNTQGIDALVDKEGNWPLDPSTAYFGPWLMRHENPDQLWDGNPNDPHEVWTSFPIEGPLRLPVLEWIRQQLQQPTYMQMTGSVCQFNSFIAIRDNRPRKRGPMRIEMATAISGASQFVEELSTPVSVIYGRANSDRAAYGKAARAEDRHLVALMTVGALRHPSRLGTLPGVVMDAGRRVICRDQVSEDWRVRTSLAPETQVND